MTSPAPAVGLVRLHILGPDATTSRGYLSGIGASGNHSKAVDGSGLTFTGNALETALASDPTILDDAFAVTELDVGGVWTPFGTPFVLAPGQGQVLGSREGAGQELSPVAVSALQALAGECIVLPNECVDPSPTLRYACGLEGNRYLGWQSKGFDDSGWNNADVFTPTEAKDGEPESWDVNAVGAQWVFRDAAEGGLTLIRFGTFVLSELTTIKFIAAADEEFKVYLDGPNMGGVIIDSTANETGYTEKNVWKKRLEPGTYLVSAEFTSVNSEGGDGNDSIRFACGTVTNKGDIDLPAIISGSSAQVWRQAKTDERPGFTPGELLRRLLETNSDLGIPAADILLDNRTFTDTDDSSETAWEDGREWVWPLGTSLASVLLDLADDCDLDLTTDFEFQAWNDRGSDLSATVALVPGGPTPDATMNIVEYRWDSDPVGPTRYLTLSQDGFDIVTGTSAEEDTRARFGFLESGASPSVARAKRNARAAIRQNGRVRRYYTAQIVAVDGAVPYTDFEVCDVVSGRNYQNAATDLEVTDIAWSQGDGTTLFTLELGEL